MKFDARTKTYEASGANRIRSADRCKNNDCVRSSTALQRTRRSGRKGFELSIGTLVWLILILIIFSGSIYFIRQFFTTIPEQTQEVDRQTEEQIRDLLREGSIAAIPINKKTVVRGGRAGYWLGIENKLNKNNDFTIAVQFDAAFDAKEKPIIGAEADYLTRRWILYSPGPYPIPNGAFKAVPITAVAQSSMTASGRATARGYYLFNVCVYPTVQTPPCTQAQADATPELFYGGGILKLIVEVA